MDKNDIMRYVYELDWNCPEKIQNIAIDYLSKVNEDDMIYIFDKHLKSTWENAVKVIEKISFPRNKSLLPNLMWLLQDINWPGSMHAITILSSIERKTLIPLIKSTLLLADEKNDFMWIAGINLLIDKVGIENIDFNDESFFEILEKRDF